MPTLQVTVGKKLFEFSTFDNWCDTAKWKFADAGLSGRYALCIDTKGRICTKGAEFMRARNEGAFPVRVFAAVVMPEEEAAETDGQSDDDIEAVATCLEDDAAMLRTFAEGNVSENFGVDEITANMDLAAALIVELRSAKQRAADLEKEINTPEIVDFVKAVQLEAAHQRQRWGTEHDAGKTTADWYWLLGHLAGKALFHLLAGNQEKGLHHIITTAAACANWHMNVTGADQRTRPGMGPPDRA